MPEKILLERNTLDFFACITYENFPDFCLCCGNIGHLVVDCRKNSEVSKMDFTVRLVNDRRRWHKDFMNNMEKYHDNDDREDLNHVVEEGLQ